MTPGAGEQLESGHPRIPALIQLRKWSGHPLAHRGPLEGAQLQARPSGGALGCPWSSCAVQLPAALSEIQPWESPCEQLLHWAGPWGEGKASSRQVLKVSLLHPTGECPGSNPCCAADSGFLLMHPRGGSRWWLKYLGETWIKQLTNSKRASKEGGWAAGSRGGWVSEATSTCCHWAAFST